MDLWGIIILAMGAIAYFATGRKYAAWAFMAGAGFGIIIAAVWANYIMQSALNSLLQ